MPAPEIITIIYRSQPSTMSMGFTREQIDDLAYIGFKTIVSNFIKANPNARNIDIMEHVRALYPITGDDLAPKPKSRIKKWKNVK